MSTEYSLPAPVPTPPGTEPPKARRRPIKTIIAGSALIVGIVIGSASTAPTEPAPAPAPVTVTETPAPIETLVVPDACLMALDAAEARNDTAMEGLTIATKMIEATSEYDLARLESLTAEINELGPSVDATTSTYKSNAAVCRSSK